MAMGDRLHIRPRRLSLRNNVTLLLRRPRPPYDPLLGCRCAAHRRRSILSLFHSDSPFHGKNAARENHSIGKSNTRCRDQTVTWNEVITDQVIFDAIRDRLEHSALTEKMVRRYAHLAVGHLAVYADALSFHGTITAHLSAPPKQPSS